MRKGRDQIFSTHFTEDGGVAVLSEYGNVTCYMAPKRDGYVVRFVPQGTPTISREQAREILNQLAYKLMSVAAQL